MRLIASALAAVLALVFAPAPAGAAAGPLPEDDPFYAVPSNIASYPNGAVIDSRSITATGLSVPLPARAWQLKYRTTDNKGKPSATVTTVLVPLLPWLGKGARPLVSYQTAEDAVSSKCAPSYGLRAGLPGGVNNASAEALVMASALANGWALSVPDYEGPHSQFLVAKTEAYGVLDGLRAARNFAPAGISENAPIGLWGYSGGSFASSVAAQYQARYAPELPIKAVVLGGYVASVRETIDAFDGSPFGGAIPMGIHGFDRGYPELDLRSYLSERGQDLFDATVDDCITDAVPRAPFLTVADIEAEPGALDRPEIAGMLMANSPLGIAGVPQAPVYHYHAILDELAPIEPARENLRRFCRAGVIVTSVQNPIGEHLTEVAVGVPGALAYLSATFAGARPVSSCGSI